MQLVIPSAIFGPRFDLSLMEIVISKSKEFGKHNCRRIGPLHAALLHGIFALSTACLPTSHSHRSRLKGAHLSSDEALAVLS